MLGDGRVIYSRWDYTGIRHEFLRLLMVMNPDGTGQRAIYGSNSWWPGALYSPRAVPGSAHKIVAVVTGHHATRPGNLVLLDTSKGSEETQGVIQVIPGRGERIRRVLTDQVHYPDKPLFLHPYPLSEKYFLAASRLGRGGRWAICLVDVFDNVIPIKEDPDYHLLEPIPLRARPKPPVIPDKVDLARKDAVVYLHDVYAGPSMQGVPRDVVRRLRIVAYHYCYHGLGGPNEIGLGGPWEVMRILGTVAVEADGSALFRVPANTPLSVQPLDAEGKAVQLMRSWFTAMPGETVSCFGCHERTGDVAPVRSHPQAAVRKPVEITPWYGPPRGLSFHREVQPVLDEYCVGCHNGQPRPDGRTIPELRPADQVKTYKGFQPAAQESTVPAHRRYGPAYEVLHNYIRRPGAEDDVSRLRPAEYHADTSELIQMLQQGHHHVRLDAEAWDRLITWIDLNGPAFGTWSEVAGTGPIAGSIRRRRELQELYGGPHEDRETIPPLRPAAAEPVMPTAPDDTDRQIVRLEDWPLDASEAKRRQMAAGPCQMTIDLGGGVTMKLVRIPAGAFRMGDPDGESDRRPPGGVSIEKPFWIGAMEVTNRQYGQFDPSHDSGYLTKFRAHRYDPGPLLDGPRQPVLRVSWQQAMDFCRWLSRETGLECTLPTEARWEYACRAGSATPLCYGAADADFSKWANVADMQVANGGFIREALVMSYPADERFDDGHMVTAPVASYRPNAWGLYDMHGNVAEWTLSTYRPYPYGNVLPGEGDGRNDDSSIERKAVRGGSFFDRPKRCRSAFRLGYWSWQPVFNVGFRVVCEDRPPKKRITVGPTSGGSSDVAKNHP